MTDLMWSDPTRNYGKEREGKVEHFSFNKLRRISFFYSYAVYINLTPPPPPFPPPSAPPIYQVKILQRSFLCKSVACRGEGERGLTRTTPPSPSPLILVAKFSLPSILVVIFFKKSAPVFFSKPSPLEKFLRTPLI